MKALLLACQTLVELKALKKTHGQGFIDAYCCLNSEEQFQVDAICATAVPYQVYKYTGETIKQNGQTLKTGTLVYLDPNASIHKGALTLPVWLLQGLELGWRQALSVSRNCLMAMEKAVTEVIEGETGNSFSF